MSGKDASDTAPRLIGEFTGETRLQGDQLDLGRASTSGSRRPSPTPDRKAAVEKILTELKGDGKAGPGH